MTTNKGAAVGLASILGFPPFLFGRCGAPPFSFFSPQNIGAPSHDWQHPASIFGRFENWKGIMATLLGRVCSGGVYFPYANGMG